jgi:hypothetical protein
MSNSRPKQQWETAGEKYNKFMTFYDNESGWFGIRLRGWKGYAVTFLALFNTMWASYGIVAFLLEVTH